VGTTSSRLHARDRVVRNAWSRSRRRLCMRHRMARSGLQSASAMLADRRSTARPSRARYRRGTAKTSSSSSPANYDLATPLQFGRRIPPARPHGDLDGPRGGVTISGSRLHPNWQPVATGSRSWRRQFARLNFDGLFVNGQRQIWRRYRTMTRASGWGNCRLHDLASGATAASWMRRRPPLIVKTSARAAVQVTVCRAGGIPRAELQRVAR